MADSLRVFGFRVLDGLGRLLIAFGTLVVALYSVALVLVTAWMPAPLFITAALLGATATVAASGAATAVAAAGLVFAGALVAGALVGDGDVAPVMAVASIGAPLLLGGVIRALATRLPTG